MLATNRASLTRAAVLATVATLGLAGCSGGSGSDAAAPSSSASPSPSTTVSIPPGQALTDQGSNLAFGKTATVVFEASKQAGTALKLTVKSAREGRLSDFKGFILDDTYKKQAHYYYVDVSVQNVGDGDVGGVPVPLWGVSGDNTLLPAVNFTTTFATCPSKPLPDKFGPGQKLDTCLVYLSPDKGTLTSVSYRPSQEFNPITWKGEIKPAQAATAHKKAKKKS
ncbi:MAG: hypothetical protein ACXVET_13475 [Nocardioidaceae bacterium]